MKVVSMIMPRSRLLLLLLLVGCGGCVSLHAQPFPFDTDPALPLAFPFDPKIDTVGIKFPVLISPTTIIPANATLRVFYIPPHVEDDSMRAIKTANNQDAAYSRVVHLDQSQKLSPSEIARQKISRGTAWPSVTNFQLALNSLPADDMRFVFIVPAPTAEKPEDFKFYDEHVVLPDGLFLGESNKTVLVLAVEKKSRGAQAGVKAGDVVVKVGDRATNGSLQAFSDAYFATRKAAETALRSGYAITVKSTDGPERELSVKLPPSINSSFLDAPITTGTTANTNTPSLVVPEVWEKQKPTQPAAPNP
jgi:hypothetical protein